jgi:hypothetical protein
MSKISQNIENKIIPKYFGLFLFIMGSNLIGLSIFNRSIDVLRYFRQPSLGIAFLILLYAFPKNEFRKHFSGLTGGFVFLFAFLFFNLLTSIDRANTSQYALWLIFSFLVIHQFLFVRNSLTFSQMLYQFCLAVWTIGVISIVVSLFGAYVLGLEIFFDERYNYSLMRMTTEFSGVFGSNNSMGFVTFITLVFSLFLFKFHSGKKWSVFFFILAISLSGLIIFIGNRASMACTAMYWILFTLYINRNIWSLLIFFTIGFLGSIYFQETIIQKLRLEQFEGGNVFGNRSVLFEEALLVARDMDFFGVGYHNQRVARKYFGVVGENDKEYNFHNTYLAVYTELGPLGLIWIPGFILVLVFWPTHKVITEPNLKFLRMLRALILVMLLIYLPVEDSINSPGSPSFYFFWISLSLLLIGSYPDHLPKLVYEKEGSFSH